jgi:hypothetical protein
MPVFIKRDKTCLFIHIPKAGGSSVEAGARRLGWKEYLSIRGVSAERLSMLKSSPQHLHASVLAGFMNFELFDLVLMICRHPLERFKSEYYWQSRQGITDLAPAAWANAVLDRVRTDPWMHDNHFRPQVEFIPDGGGERVYKIEENGVGKALAALEDLGGKGGLGNILSFYSGRFASKSSRKIPSVEDALNSFSTRVYEYYREDYERFGYRR